MQTARNSITLPRQAIAGFAGDPVAIPILAGTAAAKFLPDAAAAVADCGAPIRRGDLAIVVANGFAQLARVAMPPLLATPKGQPVRPRAQFDGICIELPGTGKLQAISSDSLEGVHRVTGFVDQAGQFRPVAVTH